MTILPSSGGAATLSNRICRLLFLLLIASTFLPQTGKLKSAAPSDLDTAVGLTSKTMAPSVPIFAGQSVRFRVAIRPDLAENPMLQTYSDLAKWPNPRRDESLNNRARQAPYRFVYSLAVPVGTYARENQCTLTMTLATEFVSDAIKCRKLADNGLAIFTFSDPLPPGVYDGIIESNASGPDNAVIPYFFTGSGGEYWLRAQSQWSSISVARAMWHWVWQDSVRAVSYGLIIALVLGLALLAPNNLVWASLASSLFLGTALITKCLSGHDETAHIDMLFRQVTAKQNLSPSTTTDYTNTFYNNVEKLKFEEDFFQLHSAAPLPPDTCPHKILGNCGHTPWPLRLYRGYAELYPNLTSAGSDARQLLLGVVAIHSALLAGVTVLILVLLGPAVVRGILPLMIFFGYLTATFPSVTNDFPMMILGIFGTACAVGALLGTARWRILGGCVLFTAALATIGRQIEKGWIAGILPAVLVVALVCFLPQQSLRRDPNEHSIKKLSGFGLAALFILASSGFAYIIGLAGKSFIGDLSGMLDPRIAEAAQHIGSLPSELWPTGLAEHFMSLVGTFVWGHSYLPGWSYLAIAVLTAWSVAQGLAYLKYRLGWGRFLLVAAVLAISAALYLQMVTAIISLISQTNVSFASTAKVRFTAAGLAPLLALPGLGLSVCSHSKKIRRTLWQAACLWVLFLLVHGLPTIFLVDLY